MFNITSEKTVTEGSSYSNLSLNCLKVLLGAVYLALLSQVEVPIRPIPITLHTFALFTMGLYMGKNKAALSAFSYLAAATMGLPVFPHLTSDPLWILDPSAGFCLSFPFAAYAIGYCSETASQKSLTRALVSVLSGAAVIYFCGIMWLSIFLGINEALAVGLYPFIPIELIKVSGAVSVYMTTNRINSLLH